MRIADVGDSMYLLLDIVTNICCIVQIALRHQIILSGYRINLRYAIALRQFGRDFISLAQLAFQLYENGLHVFIPIITIISDPV